MAKINKIIEFILYLSKLTVTINVLILITPSHQVINYSESSLIPRRLELLIQNYSSEGIRLGNNSAVGSRSESR